MLSVKPGLRSIQGRSATVPMRTTGHAHIIHTRTIHGSVFMKETSVRAVRWGPQDVGPAHAKRGRNDLTIKMFRTVNQLLYVSFKMSPFSKENPDSGDPPTERRILAKTMPTV
jgi:hypothetical protein